MTNLIFNCFLTTLFVIFILAFGFGVVEGIKYSQEQVKECRAKGGYALVERGVFQDCLIGVKSIK